LVACLWLRIDYKDVKVILCDEKDQEAYFLVQLKEKPCSLISAAKASKLLWQECIDYWCYAIDISKKKAKAEDVPVVCKFGDVSPVELLELPPQREIGCENNQLLELNSFSKSPVTWPQHSL